MRRVTYDGLGTVCLESDCERYHTVLGSGACQGLYPLRHSLHARSPGMGLWCVHTGGYHDSHCFLCSFYPLPVPVLVSVAGSVNAPLISGIFLFVIVFVLK